jgi:hypothetical protein
MNMKIQALMVTMYVLFVMQLQAFGQYKNVALNPGDVRAAGKGYPHATSNSEYPCPPASGTGACIPDTTFLALNAIDGKTNNLCHGSLACGSWGPQIIDGLWWRVDFGHDVQVDKVVIWIRHDFPHDSYWKDATLVFSDSSKVVIHPDSVAFPQTYTFASRNTNSITITNLTAFEATKWCAFTEVQAWGYDPPVSVITTRSIIASGYGRMFCYIPGITSRTYSLPHNAVGMELFTAAGEKVGTCRSGNNRVVLLPATLAQGVFRLRYLNSGE